MAEQLTKHAEGIWESNKTGNNDRLCVKLGEIYDYYTFAIFWKEDSCIKSYSHMNEADSRRIIICCCILFGRA